VLLLPSRLARAGVSVRAFPEGSKDRKVTSSSKAVLLYERREDLPILVERPEWLAEFTCSDVFRDLLYRPGRSELGRYCLEEVRNRQRAFDFRNAVRKRPLVYPVPITMPARRTNTAGTCLREYTPAFLSNALLGIVVGGSDLTLKRAYDIL
jgi:hypothetical protein